MPTSPATCALYLTALVQRGLKVSTIRRRAAAITRAHRHAAQPSPVWDPRVLVRRQVGYAEDVLERDRECLGFVA